jgi:guanosine-3',5'-bis(diphosphate) 3'-pyrophosphohydrolase
MERDSGLSLVLRAAAFASRKHSKQRRKDADASPYINHPLAVACVLASEAAVDDPVILAAALLHDTIEDTETVASDLRQEFADDVVSIVEEVSDDKELPADVRKRLQVEHAAACSAPAKLVKLADKICNVRDLETTPPTGWSRERQLGYLDWASEVVAGLRGAHPVLEALFDEALARSRSAMLGRSAPLDRVPSPPTTP